MLVLKIRMTLQEYGVEVSVPASLTIPWVSHLICLALSIYSSTSIR